MNVKMRFNRLIGLKNSRLALLVSLVAILVLAMSQWQQVDENPWGQERVEIGLRLVGDKVMKAHGDQSTPIPPIEQLGNRSFRLNLPQSIALVPDDLTGIAFETFDATYFEKALVQVYDAQSEEMVYGFNLNTQVGEEIPCLGRTYPNGDYYVQLTVLDPVASANYFEAAIMGVAGFALVIMLFSRISHPEASKEMTSFTAGALQLDTTKGVLICQGKQVSLSQKELRLMEILMQQANQLVTREYLVEEVWSKEGVVTGRSLDVFISRLRKKLAIYPNVRIVNKHGQGYVLDTTN